MLYRARSRVAETTCHRSAAPTVRSTRAPAFRRCPYRRPTMSPNWTRGCECHRLRSSTPRPVLRVLHLGGLVAVWDSAATLGTRRRDRRLACGLSFGVEHAKLRLERRPPA